MTRRLFLACLPFFLGACAFRRDGEDDWIAGEDGWDEPEEKPEISEDELKFQRWLKKRHRYRDFETYEDAREAYEKDAANAERKKRWLEYRKKMGVSQ